MADYPACPCCGRQAKEAVSSNWFPLFKCNECEQLFCHDDNCGGSDRVCPWCGSDNTKRSADKVDA